MSSLSEHEHDDLNPNDPSYYAPRWLRERSGSRSSAAQHAAAEAAGPAVSAPALLDTRLEHAVSNALWHPLDPEIIHEPPALAEELDRRAALITVVGRFAAAISVSALVALFFVIMVPASRQGDVGSATSGIMRTIKAVLLQPGQRDDVAKPAIAEFQPILASAQSSQPATREQSGQLLQQFLQWRQKPNSTETSQ
jgi:hypothetical protein